MSKHHAVRSQWHTSTQYRICSTDSQQAVPVQQKQADHRHAPVMRLSMPASPSASCCCSWRMLAVAAATSVRLPASAAASCCWWLVKEAWSSRTYRTVHHMQQAHQHHTTFEAKTCVHAMNLQRQRMSNAEVAEVYHYICLGCLVPLMLSERHCW